MKRTGQTYSYNSGKIRMAILVASAAIIVSSILIGFLRFTYDLAPVPSGSLPMPSSTASVENNSGTATSTGVHVPPAPAPLPRPTPPPPRKPAQAIEHSFGIAAGGGLSKMSASALNQELDHMVRLGIKWVRFDIEWGDVQYSSPSRSTWSGYDALFKALAAHRLHGLGVITFTPEWARTPGCRGGVECPPNDPATFATFAAQVAARYKGQGMHYWEIWNEPNNFNFWATKTDCKAYTALLKAAYPAIKQADPDAVIVTGGLAPASTNDVNISPADFLTCVYANGGKGYFDAVGDHPYSFPQMPSDVTLGAWAQMFKTTPNLKGIMAANGDAGKKIWMTEFGAPTNGPDSHWYVSESQQSRMAADVVNLYKTYDWAGPIFWYSFQDSGTATDTNENFFGLVRADGSEKPAYSTLQAAISAGL